MLDGDDADRVRCKGKREEALREKSRRVKLQATGEIDFRDIAGNFDVAGAVSCMEGVCACVWVGARARARAMNIAFRYLGRANCPRECLEAVLISCQSEFGIRHARLENASDSFSITFPRFSICALKERGERKKRRVFEVFRTMRELDLNFAYDAILDW